MGLFTSLFGTSVPTITALELQEKLKNGNRPFMLDVRQPEEFRLSHIAGATLIQLGELDRHIREVPKDREIVCICASGHRSVPAVKKLTAAGYAAIGLKNGMIAWMFAKLPTNKSGLVSGGN
jgi:rhodanese-related sulfurtransferase